MKRTIKIKKSLTGKQQQVKLQKDVMENSTFFPKGVHIEDIDKSVQETFKREFEIVSQGHKVPIYDVFSIQRFAEFMKTWKNTDKHKNIKLPFVSIVKEPIKKGTNLGGTHNLPSTPRFNLWKRPIVKNGKKSIEYYQIPQPVNIDCDYTVHLFTEHQRDVNKMDENMLYAFKESQYYINVNGHYMPLKMESMDDVSETSDIEKRRYYHKKYSLSLKGYLLREDEFKKLSSIDNIKIHTQPSIVKNSRKCIVTEEDLDCDLCLNFEFNRKAEKSKTYRIPMNIEFYYDNQNPTNNYSYFLNQQIVQLPFVARVGDELTVAHAIQTNATLNIKVCGRKL